MNDEAARVHHAVRRRGCGVADHGKGAAGGQAANYWVAGYRFRSSWQPWTDAFVERLRQLGWIEERTVTIEYRSAEGSGERFAEIAAEFVRLKVDIIVTSGAAGPAVKQATSTIPIVLGLANDPLARA